MHSIFFKKKLQTLFIDLEQDITQIYMIFFRLKLLQTNEKKSCKREAIPTENINFVFYFEQNLCFLQEKYP